MCGGQSYVAWIAGNLTLPDHQLEDLFGKFTFIPLPLFTYVGMMHLTLTTAVAKVRQQHCQLRLAYVGIRALTLPSSHVSNSGLGQ